jgi:hypothetical protein
LKFIARRATASDVFTPAGDQKRTERHPERNTKPSVITMVGVLIEPNRYSGADLRELYANQRRRPPAKVAAQVREMHARWLERRKESA